jgi:ABC-type multidrug transport system fused ATPase/permease subunit
MKLVIIYFKRAYNLLENRDKFRIKAISVAQVLLGILDLVGVVFIGLLGALSITGVQSREPGTRVFTVLKILQLENLSFQTQTACLGGIAVTFLVVKTILSVLLTRRSLFFLSLKGAQISSRLIRDLLSRDIQEIRKRGVQDILHVSTTGVYGITVGILSTGVSLFADVSSIVLIILGLIAFDPTMALLTCLLFSVIAVAVFRLQQERARILGSELGLMVVRSEELISEALSAYRELVVHDRQSYYIENIKQQRLNLASTQAEMSFMPQVSKYVIESSVILGGIVISAIQFLRLDATQAFATLAIFLAAGSRIAPAVMRLQQNLVYMRNSIGIAEPTFALIEEMGIIDRSKYNLNDGVIPANLGGEFNPSVEMQKLSFRFQDSDQDLLSGIEIQVAPGQVVALVGPSGSGKSTLVDLMLGILKPTSGKVLVSGLNPVSAIKTWAGKISYVPQDVLITKASLLENVALGFPISEINRDEVLKALRIARLEELIDYENPNLSEPIRERGSNLSGGQRQRIGIARALYTNPGLLILDEATSALDVTTESEISEALHDLKGSVTVVLVAHRLSTVRTADLVIYIDKGKIVARGTFEQVRSTVPQFDHQAGLLGL